MILDQTNAENYFCRGVSSTAVNHSFSDFDQNRDQAYLPFGSSLTVSLWRPFALRRFKTSRPLAVAIRLRKPCLFTRFLLLG
jgi:hypothetical protein